MTEPEHARSSLGWTTFVLGTVAAVVLYVGFPVFLVYPVVKVFGNKMPDAVEAPLRILFMPVVAAADHSKTYQRWITWQCEVTGLR